VSPAFSHWRNGDELTLSIFETSEMRKDKWFPVDDFVGFAFFGIRANQNNDSKLLL